MRRFMLWLQGYDLVVQYKPGKYLFVADTLLRAPLKETALNEVDNDFKLHCNMITSEIALPSREVDQIKIGM